MKETEVNAAPMTEVMAAAQRTMPNMRIRSRRQRLRSLRCHVVAASTVPPATTPRIARKRRTRMMPVTMMPSTELRVICLTCSTPVAPSPACGARPRR